MPTFIHGKGTNVFLNQFDMSAYFNSASVARSVETSDTTAFGASNKAYIVGMGDGTLQLDGMWSADATVGSDEVLAGILGSATTPIVTYAYAAGTIGNRCVVAKAHSTSFDISSPVGDVVSASVSFQASTDATTNFTKSVSSGVMLTANASIAFGSLGALASVDNAASSASGGVANLHVTVNTITGASTTIKVQHSADNSTWADLITFTAVTASNTTSQQSAVSGTVNRYLRATASGGTAGAITYNIGFARF